LHPAQALGHPLEVVNETLNENGRFWPPGRLTPAPLKQLRGCDRLPARQTTVLFDDVMDALRNLDRLANEGSDGARYRRIIRTQRLSFRASRSDRGEGQSLN
jgi:hypothetical protein